MADYASSAYLQVWVGACGHKALLVRLERHQAAGVVAHFPLTERRITVAAYTSSACFQYNLSLGGCLCVRHC